MGGIHWSLVNSPHKGQWRLSKQWWGWWFETPSRALWRHCNEKGIARISEAHSAKLPYLSRTLNWYLICNFSIFHSQTHICSWNLQHSSRGQWVKMVLLQEAIYIDESFCNFAQCMAVCCDLTEFHNDSSNKKDTIDDDDRDIDCEYFEYFVWKYQFGVLTDHTVTRYFCVTIHRDLHGDCTGNEFSSNGLEMGHNHSCATAWWRHQMETFSALPVSWWEESTSQRWIPLKKASDTELWCFLWSAPWTNIWANTRDAIAHIMTSL